MNEITIELNGIEAHFQDVWVHLQDANSNDVVDYKVIVPAQFVVSVFDPGNLKEGSVRWVEFIQREIDELGTFIIQSYLKTISRLVGVNKPAYRWVIATVDDIRESDLGIELIGKAVPFKPELGIPRLFPLK